MKEFPGSIVPATGTDGEAPSATGVTPPAELLAEASNRLGWAALIYVVCYSLAYFGPHAVALLTVPSHPWWPVSHVFAVLSISLGVIVFVMSRRATLSPQRLLDVGLVFEVIASLGISAAEFWNGFPSESFLDRKWSDELLPLDVLHDQVIRTHVIQRANVRMI